MEDTGEMVHIMRSDLQRGSYIPPGSSIDNGDGDSGSSDLDQGGVRRPRRAPRRHADDDDDTGSDLDRNGRRGGRRGGRGVGKVVGAEEEETESDLDQASMRRVIPGKKSGKMGILRRKGVSKSKGSPYRSSGSSHEDDGCPLVTATTAQRNMDHHRNGMCHGV